jgi:hypothetical protein
MIERRPEGENSGEIASRAAVKLFFQEKSIETQKIYIL